MRYLLHSHSIHYYLLVCSKWPKEVVITSVVVILALVYIGSCNLYQSLWSSHLRYLVQSLQKILSIGLRKRPKALVLLVLVYIGSCNLYLALLTSDVMNLVHSFLSNLAFCLISLRHIFCIQFFPEDLDSVSDVQSSLGLFFPLSAFRLSFSSRLLHSFRYC